MNVPSGTRSVCYKGVAVLLLLLLICYCSDCTVPKNVTAKTGEAAILPCSCPPDQPPFFLWQKVVAEVEVVVNYYTNDKNNNQADPLYYNRTHLSLHTGNCSLVFSGVHVSDEGLYKCYYQKYPLKYDEIYLKLTGPHPRTSEHRNAVTASTVCGLLVVLIIIIAAVYVGITCRNGDHRNENSL